MTLRISAVMAAFCIAMPVAAVEPGPSDGKEVDRAIQRGLEYLHRNQQNDGGWKCQDTLSSNSLAVMAFLSAGHVPGEGKYGATVERGIQRVLKQISATEAERHNGGMNGTNMYEHGISTLMLAEVAGMVDGKLGEEVRQKLEKAVAVILIAQRKSEKAGGHKGGWRYSIGGNDSDLSCTGWQVMALRAAKNLGCDVPPESIDNAVAYINRCRDSKSGGFRYGPGHVTEACTGTGILTLELCGKDHHGSPELLKAGDYLLKHRPYGGGGHHEGYSNYYCSQAMFQLGGKYWSSFRPKLHKALLGSQQANGCWSGPGGETNTYGTAMAILALTVEYRYLPIYQRGEEPTDKSN